MVWPGDGTRSKRGRWGTHLDRSRRRGADKDGRVLGTAVVNSLHRSVTINKQTKAERNGRRASMVYTRHIEARNKLMEAAKL